jgi:hypothetical protein
MPYHSGHHTLHASAAPDPGLPAGPPTPPSMAQTTDLAGNPLDAQTATGPCATAEARASLKQCRESDGAGLPGGALVAVALACALLAAGLWTLLGPEARAWADGEGWLWRSTARGGGLPRSQRRRLQRRRRIGAGLLASALALALIALVAG